MTPRWWPGEHYYEQDGDWLRVVQRKIGAPLTGRYDDETEARIRGVQMAHDIEPTGKVDEETAEVLGEPADAHLPPEWYQGELQLWDHSRSVWAVRCRLGLPVKRDDRFDPDVESAVRRFQSGHGLPVTGVVDETTAIELGECNECES